MAQIYHLTVTRKQQAIYLCFCRFTTVYTVLQVGNRYTVVSLNSVNLLNLSLFSLSVDNVYLLLYLLFCLLNVSGSDARDCQDQGSTGAGGMFRTCLSRKYIIVPLHHLLT